MITGHLTSPVVIQRLIVGFDSIGQPIPNAWEKHCDAWASIRFMNGIESIKAGAQASTAKASIRIRYRDDLTTAMRVLHGAKVFEIVAVLPDEQKREHVDLVCEIQS